MRNPLTSPRLSVCAMVALLVAAVWVTGCGGGTKEEDGSADGSRRTTQPADTTQRVSFAKVEGEIGTPADVDPAGIVVFAEGTSYSAFTDGDGRYVVSGLEPGDYRFRAMRDDLQPMVIGDVTITEADLTKPQPSQKLLRALMDARDMSAVRTSARFGNVRGQVSTLVPGDEEGVVVALEGTRHRTVALAGGEFELVNVEPGSYNVSFSRRGYTTVRDAVTVEPGQEVEMADVRLTGTSIETDPSRTVFGRVTVLTADGEPAADYSPVRVVLEGTSFSATPDSRGRFEFRNVPPGRYLIGATAPGFLLEQKFSLNLEVVPAVEIELVLIEDTTDLAEQGALYGRVLLEEAESSGNAGVAVSLAGTSHVAFTDAAGHYEIYNIDPGMYDIVASFQGYKPAHVSGVQVVGGDPREVEDLLLEQEIERPVVVYTNPSDGAREVAIANPLNVTIQFSQKMDIPSVLDALSISPNVGYRAAFSRMGTAQDTIVLELDGIARDGGAILRYDTSYTVNIKGSASSSTGVEMRDDYRMTFRTGAAMVIATAPEDGSRNAGFYPDEPIRVYFNAPLDRDSISADHIRITPSAVAQPNIRLRSDGQTGWTVLDIYFNRQADQRYTLTIRPGAKTISNDRVRNLPYRFSFTTRAYRTGREIYGSNSTTPDRDARERERDRR